MTVYASYAEFSARYATRHSQAEVESHCLPFASARLEAVLAPYFSVPFSANNVTAKDLTIDLAYLVLLQRSKAPEDAVALERRVGDRVAALAEGREAMLTTSGEAMVAAHSRGEVWSSTSRYRTVFDLRDAEAQSVDPTRKAVEP